MIHILFFGILLPMIYAKEDLQLVSTLHSDYLQKFTGYSSVIIIHFQVPDDTEFVSFKFEADQTAFSIFNCDYDEVILYMKHGSIPVVNPNDAKLPPKFYNNSAPIMHLQFLSDKKPHYVNLTSPRTGYYYATAFLPYSNPQSEAITQAGLTPQCATFIETSLHIKKYFVLDLERSNEVAITVPLYSTENQTYKFYISEEHDRLILAIRNIYFCTTCTNLTGQLFDNTEDTVDFATIIIHQATYDNDTIYYRANVREATWYYMQFNFAATNASIDDYGHLTFDIKTFTSASKDVIVDKYKSEIRGRNFNITDVYKSAAFKSIRNEHLISYESYKEYSLVKSGKSDSFSYSFDLHPTPEGKVPLSINLTGTDFTSLKFFLNEAVDTGGTLDYIVGFQPRISKINGKLMREHEPEHHIVIVCIRNNIMEIPTWPKNCIYENKSSIAPVILNKTLTNSTVMLPYPESGWWYITLKLFCGECIPCNCPDTCLANFNRCVEGCEETCDTASCSNCTLHCEDEIRNNTECDSLCNCDGPCQRSNISCNSSILFDISSFPCLSGHCGKSGRCVFMISQGILYSTCLCTNNYKGMDCTDGADATTYSMIVLELCLLVLSNLIYLIVVYFAFKRKYYVEMIVYASTFLSSSFYHMCDAGENIISVCVVRLDVLQFSDFFSGLLSIWVTLVAMSYIAQPWISICHISGCIILAFGTTLARQSLGVFIMPAVAGAVITAGRWVYLSKKTGKLFPNKRYLMINLPVGFVTTGTGLLLFGLLQTQSNYKYLHSMWHILMGVGVITVLPDLQTFLPKPEARANDDVLEPALQNGPVRRS